MTAKRKKVVELSFNGFSKPESNYFKMPNEWPNITAKITSLAELKVIEYVLRHTWGFQEYDIAKKITTDEFMNGRKGKDGDRIDEGTGLSNRSIIDGLRRAVAHGFLIEKVDDRDKARVKKYYMLNMLPSNNDENNPGVKNLHTGVKKVHSNGEQTSQRSEKETTETNKYVVVKELTERGISENVATQLAEDFPQEYIATKIDWFDVLVETGSSLIRRNPAGYLRKAITEDYEHPKCFKSKEEREKEEAEEIRLREKLTAELEAELQIQQEIQDQVIKTYGITEDLLATWEKVLDGLKLQRQQKPLYMRLKTSYLLSIEKGVATIGVDNKNVKDWLTDRAQSTVANILTGILGEPIGVSFEVLH